MLQNGKIATFSGEEVLTQVFREDSPGKCYAQLQAAFKELGIYQVIFLVDFITLKICSRFMQYLTGVSV